MFEQNKKEKVSNMLWMKTIVGDHWSCSPERLKQSYLSWKDLPVCFSSTADHKLNKAWVEIGRKRLNASRAIVTAHRLWPTPSALLAGKLDGAQMWSCGHGLRLCTQCCDQLLGVWMKMHVHIHALCLDVTERNDRNCMFRDLHSNQRPWRTHWWEAHLP